MHSLNHDVAWRILQDREGVIWVGTFGGGLNKLNPRNNKVQAYKKVGDKAIWLNENNVSAFCETSNGKLLVGTIGGGINILDRDRSGFNYLLSDSLSGAKTIRVIYEDTDRNIWVSTDKGLCLYNHELRCIRYFRYQISSDGIGENSIYSIVYDQKGSIWFSSWMGGISIAVKLSDKYLKTRCLDKCCEAVKYFS